ncbi:MAG: GNAT family N-acetyltransferase [Clostridia bacterium]|nr:GNAT family N-acetyltransferase [Clostridia bacterium]
MEKLIETRNLIIRKFREEDAEPLYENHRDEEVKKWFPNECYKDPEEAQGAIQFYVDCVDNGHLPFVLGVELKETGELIGDTGISEVEGKPGEAEIGYCIGAKYRGKGYATEILEAISGYVAERFGIREIYGRVVHGNDASAKVLEKGGYTFVTEEFGAEDDPCGRGMWVYKKEV